MYAQALQIVERCQAVDGLRAYTDPSKAATNRPCLLVTPPLIDWQTRSATWQLAVLTSHDEGSEAAWKQLDDTVVLAVQALGGDVERGQASAYYLTDEYPRVPAYLLQLTTSH